MAGPIFNKCCCCCRLKTGGIVLGWVGAVYSTAIIIALSTIAADLDDIISNIDDDDIRKSWQNHRYIAVTLITLYLINAIGTLIVSILLIRGASKSKKRYLVPWLIISGIGIFVQLISTFLQLIISFETFFSSLILVLISLYFWLCVYSLYVQIESNEMGTPVNYNNQDHPPAYDQQQAPQPMPVFIHGATAIPVYQQSVPNQGQVYGQQIIPVTHFEVPIDQSVPPPYNTLDTKKPLE